jgi:HNH endonuclease
MCSTGNARVVLRRYAEESWKIPTDHFDRDARVRAGNARPLDEILVESSPYTSRTRLKHRLYAAGLKQRVCELCGQGEEWNGRRMSLIIDHINGVRDDHRLENLRIVCPNCNATLDTHCGRVLRKPRARAACELCGVEFEKRRPEQRFCSRRCGMRRRGPLVRRTERPPYEQLMAEIEATSYLAVGRKYGVSDNAIRKWVRVYETERAGPRL